MAGRLRGLSGLARLAPRVLRRLASDPDAFATDLRRYLNARTTDEFARAVRGLPGLVPLNLRVDPELAAAPRLNVLVPGMRLSAMSGGPNTAINLAYRMASEGVPVRFVSTDVPADEEHEPLWNHFCALTGIARRLPNVEIRDASDRSVAFPVGAGDVFFATAWWTAQMIRLALPLVRSERFLYQIVEFEPGLYPWSTEYALALETYSLDFYGLIGQGALREYLARYRIGRFAEPEFLEERCASFEPAVDTSLFRPASGSRQEPGRTLLFYARPTKARRNLGELGLHALREAIGRGSIDPGRWRFRFIGEEIPPVDLGNGVTIRSGPWLDYPGYAELLRSSDVLLSLMLSPHTSYPPLEMAACDGMVVTNTYATKDRSFLGAISANIIPVEPTCADVVRGLEEAVRRVETGERRQHAAIGLPGTWGEAFAEVLPRAIEMYEECRVPAR